MAKDSKKKYHKIGAVLRTAKNDGVFVALGNSKAKDAKYRNHVEITLKDDSGKVLASTVDGTFAVFNPRQRPGISDEDAAKIPDKVVSELFIVKDAE